MCPYWGETAEMPSFYLDGEYELAGFCVGVVNRDKLLDGKDIRPGDVLLGLPSNGLHSNGFSLVRKLFSEDRGFRLDETLEGFSIPLGEELLRPTRIYTRPVMALLEHFKIKGFAHITGGGLSGNIPRILPKNCRAVACLSNWPQEQIFTVIAKEGNIPLEEMLKTFNCGIGMVIVMDQQREEEAVQFLRDRGEDCYHMGEVTQQESGSEQFFWKN